MISIENLTKKYGDLIAVNDLTLEIKTGEVFGFVGPNGAGKSTTIRCLLNFISKNSGKIFIDGKEFNKDCIKEKAKIGYLPSEISLYDDLTGTQIIEYSKKFYSTIDENKITSLCHRLNFNPAKKFDEYSFGNKKKLGIILCLMHNPAIIIMDEATSGLDPLVQDEFYKIIEDEKKLGKTILFSSHNLSEVKRICDRVGMIKEGKLIFVENINKMSESLLVTLHTSKKLKKSDIPFDVIYNENKIIKFIYKGTTKDLISFVSKFEIEKLLIEEPSIEEMFLHFYK